MEFSHAAESSSGRCREDQSQSLRLRNSSMSNLIDSLKDPPGGMSLSNRRLACGMSQSELAAAMRNVSGTTYPSLSTVQGVEQGVTDATMMYYLLFLLATGEIKSIRPIKTAGNERPGMVTPSRVPSVLNDKRRELRVSWLQVIECGLDIIERIMSMRSTMDSQKSAILEYIRENPGCGNNEIAEAGGEDFGSSMARLQQLKNDGLVRKTVGRDNREAWSVSRE